ncbi:MAG: response regulator transcription factor [Pseudomonadota bacterium]
MTTQDDACRLLLVEDDVAIGEMLERGLNGAGYQVDWVSTLAEGVEEARRHVHQLVVLDRMLPDGDGAAFCAALRSFGHGAAICMLTARDTLEDKLSGFEAGAEDYLTKPFEFEELLARLAVLRRRVEDQKPRLRLDPERRRLTVGAEAVKLTSREALLMTYLFDRAGEVLTRSALMSEAWGVDDDITENSVDVYIGYLRRKLKDIGAAARIETVRGEGFQLVLG